MPWTQLRCEDFGFEADLIPGDYRVEVTSDGNIPGGFFSPYVAVERLEVR